MLRFSVNECRQWLVDHDFTDEESGHHFSSIAKEVYGADFAQPANSRGQAVLSKIIAQTCQQYGETFLFVSEWGVWPTEESWPLFNRAMIGYGDSRPLQDAPGFLFAKHELDDLASLVRFAINCGWAGAILSAASLTGFILTDDDWFGAFADCATTFNTCVDRIVRDLNPKILWKGEIPPRGIETS